MEGTGEALALAVLGWAKHMVCSLIPEGSFVLTESSKVSVEESYGYKALEILWTLHDQGANHHSVVDPISMVKRLHFHITLVKHSIPQ